VFMTVMRKLLPILQRYFLVSLWNRGWATSALLRHSLIAYVGREIRDLMTMQGGVATPEAIDAAITSAFLRLDGEIIDDGLKAMTDSQTPGEAVSRTAPARAGSCALLAVHDPVNSILRVACAGDSRAVLGRRPSPGGDDRNWTTIELSSDQTGFNPDECARLAENHPGESKIIDPKSGRLMGIAITRAFGDHRWKWPTAAIERFSKQFFGSGVRPHYQTPPYMTAEPVITTTQVQKGDFVILASDGFWDRVTNEDAVGCVTKWINRESSSKKGGLSEWSIHKSQGVGFPDGKVSPDTFVVEDENVATHLVRNALGGNRREHFCGELSLQSPDSRYERDDITVQVIFFGDVGRAKRARV
jgi:pyruvate dehydrogenase phosphatase